MSTTKPLLTVLVTGGCGFLGQHLIKLLHFNQNVKEIRVLDIKPFYQKLEYVKTKSFRAVCGDVNNLSEEAKQLFIGVDCVFHCAALVSYQYPPDEKALYTANVQGTKSVIEQCIQNNIPYLVFTSGTEVCQKPYFKNGYFSVIVYQTEDIVGIPSKPNELIFEAYGKSKLEGEKLVLQANNRILANGTSRLKTVSLRPTMLYGEGDEQFIPNVKKVFKPGNGILWKLLPGGKHQITYAGNAAWAHVCAMETLIEDDQDIGGLAMFITDNTPIYDLSRSAHSFFHSKDINANTTSDAPAVKPPRKPFIIPAFIHFLFIWLIDFMYYHIFIRIKSHQLPISPKLSIKYLCSILLFNRLRANLRINYNPLFSPSETLENSSKFYKQYCQMNKI